MYTKQVASHSNLGISYFRSRKYDFPSPKKRGISTTFSSADAFDSVTDLNVVVFKGHESICRRVARLWTEDTRVTVLPVKHFIIIGHLPIDLSANNDKSLPHTIHIWWPVRFKGQNQCLNVTKIHSKYTNCKQMVVWSSNLLERPYSYSLSLTVHTDDSYFEAILSHTITLASIHPS